MRLVVRPQRRSRRRRTTLRALAAAAVLPTLVGCAGGGLTNGASAVDKATASPAPTPTPQVALLPGTTLRSFLLTSADVPSGYRPAAAYTRDSGDVLAPPGQVVPGPDVVGCEGLLTTGFLSQLPAAKSASFAQDEFDDPAGQTITSAVADYRDGDAGTVMAKLLKRLSDCSDFLDRSDSNQPRYRVRKQAGPAIGDDSVQFEVTSAQYLGGETAVVVRIGNLLVSAFHSTTDAGDTGGTAYGDAATVAERVIAAVGRAGTGAS